jgi:nitrile hydratase
MSHSHDVAYPALRTKAIESLLIEKGLLTEEVVDRIARAYEEDIGPLNGARAVARAWVDPAYRDRLLENAPRALHEIGIHGADGENLVALANEPGVHNVVVCTLCSCYPWRVLGLPPSWYKSPEYRARVVREPRVVLQEFGLELPDDAEIRVWDSSAELRFLVVPERPAGTERLSENELVPLVTRNSMVGVALASSPAA